MCFGPFKDNVASLAQALPVKLQPTQVKKKVVKKRGRRGFGGLWRAYVREQSLGRKGTPDLREVAEKFRADVEAKAETLKQLRAVGKAATRAARVCRPKAGASSFGPTGRQTQDRHVRELRQRICIAIAGMDKEEGALVVAQQLSFVGAKIETCLLVARSALKRQSMLEKSRLEEQRLAMVAFQQGKGQDLLRKLKEAVPGLPLENVTPIPSSQGLCFECAPASGSLVSQGVGWASAHKDANTGPSMKRFWEDLHHIVMDSARPETASDTKKPSECYVAGVCLCSGEGTQLRSLKNSFLRAMKTIFHPGTEQRTQLASGQVLVRLEGRPREDDEDAFLDLDDPIKVAIFHVGMMYFSPYRPTFQLMRSCSDNCTPSLGQRLQLQASV